MSDIKLTDLIRVDILQQIQDSFSRYTGMAALTTDADGIPVTEGSGFTHFCMDMVRGTSLGRKRCSECDKMGAIQTLQTGKTAVYRCHAGLVDFAAPIMLEGRLIGSFIGGQVRAVDLEEETIRQTAKELGLDEEKLVAAARDTYEIGKEEVERAADFLSQIANILSEMTYNNYTALQKSRKQERATRTQMEYVLKVSTDLQDNINEWIKKAKGIPTAECTGEMRGFLSSVLRNGPQLARLLEDTVDFIKMAEGTLQSDESEYNVREFAGYLAESIKNAAEEHHDEVVVEVAEDVPEVLFGDQVKIGQVINRLLLNSVRYTENGRVGLHLSCRASSYASELIIEISDTGGGMSQDQIDSIWNAIDGQEKDVEELEKVELGITMIGNILKQMEGTMEVSSEIGRGTTFTICLPQLEVR